MQSFPIELPIELRDIIGDYTQDFLTAFLIGCSHNVLRSLSLNYIEKYNVYEHLRYEECDQIVKLYHEQQDYNDLNYNILCLLIKFHETCHATTNSVPTFPFANNLKCLKLLYNNGYEVEYATFVLACRFGSLECVDYLFNHFKQIKRCDASKCPSLANKPRNLLDHAIDANNMENTSYLLNKFPTTDRSAGYAARHGNMALMQTLFQEYNCPKSAFALQMSVEFGNKFQMLYLKQLGCPFDEQVFATAVKNNKFCILRKLVDKSCTANSDIINYAIYASIEMVDCVLEMGFTWQKDTFKLAATLGNLEMMKFIFERDCPFSKGTFRAAVELGDLINIKWLFEMGCPVDTYTYASAVLHNDLELLEFLHGKSTLNNFCFEQAAAHCTVKVLHWLEAHGCPFDKGALLESAELNENVGIYLHVVKMVKQIGSI